MDAWMVLCSWVDVEQSTEFAEPPSEFFEQRQDNHEEGKYNMNNTYHSNSLHVHLNLCTYKVYLATILSSILTFWDALGYVMLVAASTLS